MIKVITEGSTITVASVAELKDHIDEIFREDPRDDVLLTYVVSMRPTSRRTYKVAPDTI